MITYYKTIRTYAFWAASSVIFMPICLALALLPENKRYNKLYYIVASTWNCFLVFFGCFCIKKSQETETLPNFYQHPAIFVLNHSSALDILLAEVIAGKYPHIWISKIEYAKIPLWGFLLKRMHSLMDKNNPRKSLKELIKTYHLAAKNKLSVFIFPEGTRSEDGKINSFNSGFIMLAKKLNYPIIPISIYGANLIMKKNSFLINPRASDIKINIGKPMLLSKEKTDKEFLLEVENWFKLKLNQNVD